MEWNNQTLEQISMEAAEWFITLREQPVSEECRTRFSEWLLLSPDHIGCYLEIARTAGEVDFGLPVLGADPELSAENLIDTALREEQPSNVRPLSALVDLRYLKTTAD